MKAEFENSDSEVISLLGELGLSRNESIVFKFLVEKGTATVIDMNKNLRIRQPQLYDILFSLERKGLINVIEGRPKVYESVDIETVIKEMQKDLDESRKFLSDWANRRKGRSVETPAIWVSRAWRSFRNNAFSIMKNAQEYILIQTPLSFAREIRDELQSIREDSVRVLLLIYGNGLEENELEEIVQSKCFSDVGLIELGQFFSIVGDGNYSSFAPRNVMEKEKGERYGYIFRDMDMTWFIIHNFFMGWFEGKMLKRSVCKVGSYYTNQRLALYDLANLIRNEKREVWVEIRGRDLKLHENTTVSGYVENVVTTNDVFTLNLRTKSGEVYTVGGYGAKGERMEARRIKITSIK